MPDESSLQLPQGTIIERFDFSFTNEYFVDNIKIDKRGVRVRSVSSAELGRVIAQDAILFQVDPKPNEPQKAHYLQYRIDELNVKTVANPKIIVGLCLDDFLVNQDLSRQQNVWCMSCQSGDKLHNAKWSDYYDAANDASPITVGTIIGILVDTANG